MDTKGRGKYSKAPLSWQHLGVGRLSERPVGEERASEAPGASVYAIDVHCIRL